MKKIAKANEQSRNNKFTSQRFTVKHLTLLTQPLDLSVQNIEEFELKEESTMQEIKMPFTDIQQYQKNKESDKIHI